MTKNTILAVLLVLMASQIFSQKVFFPKEIVDDSLKLENHLKITSEMVLKSNKQDSTSNYYENLFHLQIASSKYNQAQNNIDAYLEAYSINRLREGRVFVYEVYLSVKEYQKEHNISFKEAYEKCFSELYDKLPKEIIPGVERSFDDNISISDLKNDFLELLKDENTDSLSINKAKSICIAYNKYKVYAETGTLGKKMLRKKDSEIFTIEDDILIKMPDGANLTALIIRKKDVKKTLPAIFIYNIYAGAYDYEVAKRAATNGYVGVVVNTRGKKLSKEEINPFENDGKDSYSIIDWISKQPWCNGKVGMMGGSYLGFSQWSATKNMHPSLKTIIPQVAVGIGIDFPMQNNVFMNYMLQWIHYLINNKYTDLKDFRDNIKWDSINNIWYKEGLAFRKLDSLNGKPNKIFHRWLDHPDYDEYWQKMVPFKDEFKNINIPVLTTTGYFDGDQLGALYYFNEHYKWNPNANHYLVIGPYSHPGGQHYASKMLGKYKLDKVANISMHKLAYQWFDYILKGKQKPWLLKDKINYQRMNTNRWEHTSSFAKMNTDSLVLYLDNVTDGEYYKLSKNKNVTNEFIKYEIDLSNRREDNTSESFDLILDKVNKNNRLSFLSEPFEQAVSINGAFTGELIVELNKKDMDVSICLYEVLPDGKFFYLSDYLGRASYAKDNSNRHLLILNQKNHIPIKRAFMTSKKIEKGSKLLVVLTINKSPYWQINYGTGKDVSEETIKDAGEPLLIKWYNNSYIKIGINREDESTTKNKRH